MNLDHKIFGGIITGIMVVALVWYASILLEQYDDPVEFDFLTDDQIIYIKEMESRCNNYNANSKFVCMSNINTEILQFQIDGASTKAIQLDDVTICHSISSDVDCLLATAQKSGNKDACYEIINSHEKFESSDEDNLKYLKSLQEFCLHRYTS